VACPERRLQWRALLDTYPGLKVGITWQGGLKRTFRSRRTIGLNELKPLFRIPGITWVSLGYEEDTERQIKEFQAENPILGMDIKHWKRAVQSDDYDDTAALVAELDLIISVPTAVVHLAGGLGKEVWVMRPELARWFYWQSGADGKNIWYPNVKCFSQKGRIWPTMELAGILESRVR
jgi:hypothetical protein